MADVVARMIEVLDQERRVLLSGDYTQLAALADRKARLGEAMARRQIPAAELGRLSTVLARNQALTAAALAGLREADARRQTLASGSDGLATYDRDGRRTAATPRGELEKRS